MSETVLIIVGVIGVLCVIGGVIGLIFCITSKQKDRVHRIRPRQQRRFMEADFHRPYQLPKPPPYSEAPPSYDTLSVTDLHGSYLTGSSTITSPPSPQPSTSRPTSYTTRHGSPHPSTSSSAKRNNDNDRRKHKASNKHRKDCNNRQESLKDSNQSLSREEAPPRSKLPRRIQKVSPSNVEQQVSDAVLHEGLSRVKDDRDVLLPGELPLQESPPPRNNAAAKRSEQRKAALQRLHKRFQDIEDNET